MGHDPQPGEIVLHAALLSELSTAGSWANENSVLYPILSEDKYLLYVKCHKQHKLGICDRDDLLNPIH